MPAVANLVGMGEHERIRRGFWLAMRLLVPITLPLVAGVAVTGPALLRLAYGEDVRRRRPGAAGDARAAAAAADAARQRGHPLRARAACKFIVIAGLVATRRRPRARVRADPEHRRDRRGDRQRRRDPRRRRPVPGARGPPAPARRAAGRPADARACVVALAVAGARRWAGLQLGTVPVAVVTGHARLLRRGADPAAAGRRGRGVAVRRRSATPGRAAPPPPSCAELARDRPPLATCSPGSTTAPPTSPARSRSRPRSPRPACARWPRRRTCARTSRACDVLELAQRVADAAGAAAPGADPARARHRRRGRRAVGAERDRRGAARRQLRRPRHRPAGRDAVRRAAGDVRGPAVPDPRARLPDPARASGAQPVLPARPGSGSCGSSRATCSCSSPRAR